MAEKNNDGDMSEVEPQKKKLVIKPLRPPFDLETAKLGTLKVGHLTIAAITKISPDLDPGAIPDVDLVKSLLLSIAVHAPDAENEAGKPLDPDELDLVTDSDLSAFALGLLNAEGWDLPTDSSGASGNAIKAVADRIRSMVKNLGGATRQLTDQLKGVLSQETSRMFMMNTAMSELLKEKSGISSLARLLKDESRFSAVAAAANALQDRNKLSEMACLAVTINKNDDISAAIRAAGLDSPEYSNALAALKHLNEVHIDAPKIDTELIHARPPIGLVQPNSSVKHMAEINQKVDEIKQTANTAATAIGLINEAIANALLEFKAKQIKDARSQNWAIWIAAISLVASMIIGFVSMYYAREAVVLAEASAKSETTLQTTREKNAADQTRTVQELKASVEQQSELVKGIRVSMDALQLERSSLKTGPKPGAKYQAVTPENLAK